MVAYRNLRRSVPHFCEMQSKTAVTAHVRLIHDQTSMGSRVRVPGSDSRTRLELSSADAMVLLTSDRFIHQSHGHMGFLAGLKALFSYLNVSKTIIEPASAGQSGNVLAYLLAQYATVATNVREHLRLRAARDGPPVQQDGAGINEGNWDPWIRDLLAFDMRRGRSREPVNCMRLVNAEALTRAAVTAPTNTSAVDGAAATAPAVPAEEEAAAAATATAAAVLASEASLVEDILDAC